MKSQNLNLGAYDLISMSILVTDICSTFIETYDVNMSIEAVNENWFIDKVEEFDLDPIDQVALVQKNNKVIGFLLPEDLNSGEMVIDSYQQFEPDVLLSANTSIIDFAQIVSASSHQLFFIIDGNEIVGWLNYKDLNKAPFHLCLMSVFFELERSLLYVLLLTPKMSFALLSSEAQLRALDLYKKKGWSFSNQGLPYHYNLLECTTLTDRIKMVKRLPFVKDQFIPAIKNRKYFDLLINVRNEIAHPGLVSGIFELIRKEDLWPFIRWAFEVSRQLIDYYRDKSKHQMDNHLK